MINNIRRKAIFIVAVSALFATKAESQTAIVVKKAQLKIQQNIEIPAETEGVLTEVNVTEGMIVEQGKTIARINDVQARLKLAESKMDRDIEAAKAANDIDVRFARKSLEVAQANLKRAEFAIEQVKDSIAGAEMDRLKLIVEQFTLGLEQAGKNHDIATMNTKLKSLIVDQRHAALEQHTIKAPLSGMVVAVERHRGEWVNSSDPIARIVRVDKLRVEGFVTAEEAARGLMGAEMTFQPELEHLKNQVFKGKIVFVNPDAIPANGKLRVWAEIDNSDLKLVPGLKGTMTINATN